MKEVRCLKRSWIQDSYTNLLYNLSTDGNIRLEMS